jgi:hypothetical protein
MRKGPNDHLNHTPAISKTWAATIRAFFGGLPSMLDQSGMPPTRTIRCFLALFVFLVILTNITPSFGQSRGASAQPKLNFAAEQERARVAWSYRRNLVTEGIRRQRFELAI